MAGYVAIISDYMAMEACRLITGRICGVLKIVANSTLSDYMYALLFESLYRLDIEVMRDNEFRIQSISYALGFLAVLTVIHTQRDRATRNISFRPASTREREAYGVWLKNEYDDTQ